MGNLIHTGGQNVLQPDGIRHMACTVHIELFCGCQSLARVLRREVRIELQEIEAKIVGLSNKAPGIT